MDLSASAYILFFICIFICPHTQSELVSFLFQAENNSVPGGLRNQTGFIFLPGIAYKRYNRVFLMVCGKDQNIFFIDTFQTDFAENIFPSLC